MDQKNVFDLLLSNILFYNELIRIRFLYLKRLTLKTDKFDYNLQGPMWQQFKCSVT